MTRNRLIREIQVRRSTFGALLVVYGCILGTMALTARMIIA